MRPVIMKRREAVALLLAAPLLPIAACSSGSDLPTARSTGVPGEPVAGGRLRVNVAADPASMHPWQYASGVDRHVLFTLYEPIIELSLRDFTLRPSIARSWSVDRTGRVATLELQPEINFSDGSPVRPEDVIFSIQQAKDPKASRTSGLLSAVTELRKTGSHTVQLRLTQPDRELFSTLADVLVAKADPDQDFSDHPVGTGPFRFESWNRGRNLTVVQNPDYWRPGLPHLDAITFNVVSDQTTSLLQVQSGQADLVDQVSFAQLEQARSAGVVLSYPEQGLPAGLYELFLNTRRPPFDDERVRQALSLAIDRPRIAQVLLGVFSAQSNPIPPDSPNFDPTAASYDHPDPDRARALLAEAGHPDGVDGGALYVYSDLGLDYITAAQVIQDSAAKAGIRLEIRQLDVASWADQVLARLDYTVGFGSAVAKPIDYDRIAHTWAKALGEATGWPDQNPGFYRQLAELRQSTTDGEYRDGLRAAQRAAMAGQPIIVVGGRKVPVGHVPAVQGFLASPQSYLLLREVWLA